MEGRFRVGLFKSGELWKTFNQEISAMRYLQRMVRKKGLPLPEVKKYSIKYY